MAKKQITVKFKIVAIVDTFGSFWAQAIDETGVTVQVHGIKYEENLNCDCYKDDEGKQHHYFESEAYHLKLFCEEHNLQYFEIDREETFEADVK